MVYEIIQKLDIKNCDITKVVESFLKPGLKFQENTNYLQKVGEAVQVDCCFKRKGVSEHLYNQSVILANHSLQNS